MQALTKRKWFYPVIYLCLIAISILPPVTEVPYDPRNTQDVIKQILMVAIQPYQAWGWVFHAATLGLVLLAVFAPQRAGRVTAAYFGINYLIIAALQTNTVTETYGFAVQTGALIAAGMLGVLWLVVAWRGKLEASFVNVPRRRWLLLPLAILVFWSPITFRGELIAPNFNPVLLLTSPDYGLAYCFMTPVFLFLLILFYPNVDGFAFRVTAFNGLIYGIYNLTHWSNPNTVWMGAMHLPLLVISLVALFMLRLGRNAGLLDDIYPPLAQASS